ncbi:MAG: hypothetical protein ACRELB_01110, partial [Polyangiaceae bacterium]
GKVAPPDYRDYIADRIQERFRSRYRFCKETGVPEAFLSQVLSGKKDFSIETLRRIAESLDLAVAILAPADLANATLTDAAVYSRMCASLKDEIATLKKVKHTLSYQRGAARRMASYEKERQQLFDTGLEPVDARLAAVPAAHRGTKIMDIFASEIKKREELLANVRERLASAAEPGRNRAGGVSGRLAQVSRV